jgi:polyisoprenoid-binding protein YceI
MRNRATVLCVVAALLTVSAAAQSGVFELDARQSRVTFTLPATLHTVHGTFALKSGRIQFDRASGSAIGQVTLDATSGETGNGGRDRKMHSDILESGKFPEIVFAARRLTGDVPKEGRSQVTLEGAITLHGATHPVSLTVPIEAHGGQVVGDASFVVPYIAWGLKNPSTFVLRVSDKVTVEVHAVGRVSH